MKNQIKKISLIALLLFLVCACSNSNSSGTTSNQESDAANQRESFSNSTVAKLLKEYDFYPIPPKEEILKGEYTTIEELLKNTFSKRWSLIIEKSKKDIEEAEKTSKTKFYLFREPLYGKAKNIYFAAKESSGYDFGVLYVGDNYVSLDKYSIKDFTAKSSLYILHEALRDSVDIPSFGLDKETTEKLLQAQTHKGI